MGTKITKNMLRKLIKEELNNVLLTEQFVDLNQDVQVDGKPLPQMRYARRGADIPGIKKGYANEGMNVLLLPGDGGQILAAGIIEEREKTGSRFRGVNSWQDAVGRAHIVGGHNVVDEAWVKKNLGGIIADRFSMPLLNQEE